VQAVNPLGKVIRLIAEQLKKVDDNDVASKLVGNINVLKLAQLLKAFAIPYLAFAEQVDGKYTFSNDVQLRNAEPKSTAVDGDTGLGNPLNFIHNKPIQPLKATLKFTFKLLLGIVRFFKETQFVKTLLKVVQLFKVVGNDTVLKELHPLKVLDKFVIEVALLGKVISNKFKQPKKVDAKVVKLAPDVGITTTNNLTQL